MIFDLKVNALSQPDAVKAEFPVFSWECEEERQFTVQMAADPQYRGTVLYLDTHNTYCAYDGFPLKDDTLYYWRVRSGIGEWTESSFKTAVSGRGEGI